MTAWFPYFWYGLISFYKYKLEPVRIFISKQLSFSTATSKYPHKNVHRHSNNTQDFCTLNCSLYRKPSLISSQVEARITLPKSIKMIMDTHSILVFFDLKTSCKVCSTISISSFCSYCDIEQSNAKVIPTDSFHFLLPKINAVQSHQVEH